MTQINKMKNISLVASSIRPNLWKGFMNSLKGNEIDYEVIFVGDVKPDFELPNMKYIYSPVKPAQCYEIGFRKAEGELVSWTSDEAMYSIKALDNIYKFHKSQSELKLVSGFTVFENNGTGISETSSGHRLATPDSPRMMCFGVIDRLYFRSLGGYDKYFITGQAENDVCMRVYFEDGTCKLCLDAIVTVNHTIAHKDDFSDSKFRKWYPQSRDRLNEMWFIDGVWCPTPCRPFVPFDDDNLLTESQGPKGEW